MSRRALGVGLVTLAALVCGDSAQGQDGAIAVPAGCIDPPPCVYVTPDPAQAAEPGTVFVFHGREWRPRTRIRADYGEFCAPTATGCEDEGAATTFRAGRDGRFTFRLVFAEELPPSTPRPAGAGGSQDTIRFSGRGLDTKRTARRDAILPPPPVTPEQRADVDAIVPLVRRAATSIFPPRTAAVRRSMARYERQLRRCDKDLTRFREGSDRDRVIGSLRGLAFDAASLEPILPQLRRFADGLERAAISDPVVRAGGEAWIAAIRRPRPWPEPDLCSAVARWKATGFDLARAPVDHRTRDPLELQDEVELSPAIRDGARRLRALGAGRKIQLFFGGDLVDLAALLGEGTDEG